MPSRYIVRTPAGGDYTAETIAQAERITETYPHGVIHPLCTCGQVWPCPEAERRDIRPDIRASHHVLDHRGWARHKRGDE